VRSDHVANPCSTGRTIVALQRALQLPRSAADVRVGGRAAAGGGPSFWRQVFAAPLLKLDAIGVGRPCSEYTVRVFPSLPAPALLHFCAFERCGAPDSPAFDCNYPDLLPPATVFGSTCDLQAMMLEAARHFPLHR
jgi:hypothetical protein